MLKILFPIFDFLYILQLEEYDTKRYFKNIKRLFWKRNLQRRGKLDFTKRVKILFLSTLPLNLLFFPLIPVWIGIVNFLLNPYFEWAKRSVQKKASVFFAKKNKHTKVIAIAGSYGKTTVKNYIYELVRFNYKTQIIPGNINTPTGIANWVLKYFDPTSELLLVEVDSYFIGEINRSLAITPPDIAILTNIGDQHLERFKSSLNLKKALEEVFEFAKPDAIKITGKSSNEEYALEVANILDIPNDIIKDTITKLSRPDRRGNIKTINNFEVIDQSYNISESTAKQAVDEAVKFANGKKKKLIVITAGIPELGKENNTANKNLGNYLVKKGDKIILLKSILHKEVINKSDKFVLVNDLSHAWKHIEKFDPEKYVVLMFPELNDLYY